MTSSHKPSVAKDVFAYLLTFAMLYVGVISFLTLLWQIINVRFPDPIWFSYGNSYDAMRNAIASLIVVWPVFLLMSRHITRDMAAHQEKADLWVRKWLTYLTIFVAAITMIVDLISLLNSFLSGELTLRFALKVIAVLAVAAAVFAYEFWELRRESKEGKKPRQMMVIGSILALVLAVTGGFYFVGAPKTARAIRLDSQRVSDLQNIQYQVIDLWNKTGSVPETLSVVSDPLTGFVVPVDPETRQAYGYKKTSDLSFELCADFKEKTPQWEEASVGRASPAFPSPYPLEGKQPETWTHESGYICFPRTINPARHKTPTP